MLGQFICNPRRKQLFSIVLITSGAFAMPSSATHAQGVWEEPSCGVEALVAVEASCGVEATCGCESVCGCRHAPFGEPQCGAEPELMVEPQCGVEPRCGSGSCGCQDRERGLLSHDFVPRGLLYHSFAKVASGLEAIATYRPAGHRTRSKTGQCACGECSAAYGQVSHSSRVPQSGRAQSLAPTHEPPLPTPRQTTIQRNPPMQRPVPAKIDPSDRPGSTFDELNDPFQDDSAGPTATRAPSIRRATYASSHSTASTDSTASRTAGSTDTSGVSEADRQYADYFRQ